jgi:hypothetical protein
MGYLLFVSLSYKNMLIALELCQYYVVKKKGIELHHDSRFSIFRCVGEITEQLFYSRLYLHCLVFCFHAVSTTEVM